MENFTHDDRLHKKSEFDQVFRGGKRLNAELLSLIIRPNGLGWNRLGLAVSRKAGEAVVRNRIKRWGREVFRRNRDAFPAGADIVITVSRPIGDATFADFRESCLKTCSRYR